MRSSEATLLSELRELSETNSATLIRPIVPIDEWLESPYYIGDLCYELYPKYKQHLRSIFDPERDESDYIDEVIMRCSIGTGKSQPLSSLILTPSGYVKMEDIHIGDKIIDGLGHITNVTGIFPQGELDVYKVTFHDNTYTYCSLDHLWKVHTGVLKENKFITKTTKEMISEGMYDKEFYKKHNIKAWNHFIPVPKLDSWESKEVPIDPYLLGYILGDGCLSGGLVSLSIHEEDLFYNIRSLLNSLGLDLSTRFDKFVPGDYRVISLTHEVYTITTYNTKRSVPQFGNSTNHNFSNKLNYELYKLGLLGHKSIDKFIPKEYLYNSIDVRTRLLQGLWDTDGCKDGTFSTSSKQLSEDFAFLVRSLGATDKIQERHPALYDDEGNKIKDYNTSYRHMVKFPTGLKYYTSKKHDSVFEPNVQREPYRRIINIEYSHREQCQCIKVDSEDETYITNDLIVTHNTSVSNVILLRKLYELSCYSDIRPLYNLMSSKTILMVYFSITREVAETTGYSQLRQMLLDIPYFKEHFSPNTKRSYDIDFPQYNMSITSGSRPANALGGDVIASVIDEGDFYGVAGTQDSSGSKSLSKAQSLYSSITKRARSRFMVGGRNYALNMIISSPTYESSFISKLIESSRGNPHTYIIEETLWTVKPKGTYSEERFVVFKGSTTLDPVIVTETNFLNQFLATMYKPPIKFTTDDPVKAISELPLDLQNYFIKIPIDFRKDFEIDLLGSLQDIASVPTAPLGRLFTSTRHYTYAIQNMQSPFIQDSIIISTNKMDETTIQKYFKPDYKPEHPELPRFLHFDQSITGDEAGVACAYPEILGRDKDGNIIKRITVEWMMLIKPPNKPEQIDLRKMRSILYYLRDTLHLRIGLITFDSFASEEAIQVLRNDGFNAELLSVDRTDKPYTELVQLYYQQLIRHPDHQRYREELFALIHYRDKGKVDHTENLDKGITDAVAGSVYNALLRTDIYSELAKEDVNVILNLL